jgi:hypothetical protein
MHSRHFNKVVVDDTSEPKAVIKSSKNIAKLKYEVYFYKSAPYEFTKFMPPLLDYADDFSWYKMEYINAPNLGQLCVSEDLSFPEWGKVFASIGDLLTRFDVPNEYASASTLEQIFIDKGLNRVHDISLQEVRNLYTSEFTINGKTLLPIAHSIELARNLVGALQSKITTLHGDLCFSNILYEKSKNKLTIVDPRGGFSEPSAYGPVIYDVAKLAQSVYGRYEQVVEKQYALTKNDSNYELKISRPETYECLENLYEELLKTFNVDKSTVKVLAGLLLVATPSLHLDDKTRALALALRGAELLNGE